MCITTNLLKQIGIVDLLLVLDTFEVGCVDLLPPDLEDEGVSNLSAVTFLSKFPVHVGFEVVTE